MFKEGYVLSLIVAVITLHLTAVESQSGAASTCDALYKCSDVASTKKVYGTGRGSDALCLLFKNECQLNWYNCKRKENNKKTLKLTSNKKKCCRNVGTFCTDQYDPVCTSIDSSFQNFGNICRATVATCQRTQDVYYAFEGACA